MNGFRRKTMKKSVGLLFATVVAFTSTHAFASGQTSKQDPYVSGFENYAKENKELSSSMQSYIKELQQIMKANPELNESKTQAEH